ncbi:MAG: DNA repair protein RecN (Recombination protein N) [Saprospiraceae bacterium]|jgi:DNA repair protein RecN (Recombination protein N)
MLKRLEIQNYAIIESLELDLTKGLSIVTGETGAGKSILLGALGLIMGKRADSKVLYEADKKCVVEAVFDVSEYNIQSIFEAEGIDYEKETIIRRLISPNGKSRAFINDEPTTLSVLKAITDNLVDLHQQFDMLDLHSVSFQTKTIDALAGVIDMVDDYRTDYVKYSKSKRTLASLEEKHRNANQEMDFLNFQMKEFNDAELIDGEQEEKEKTLDKLTNAEDIQRVGNMILHQLDEDDSSSVDTIQTLLNELSGVMDSDEKLAELYERLTNIQEEMRDIAKEAGHIAEITEYDEGIIEELNARLSLIYRLQKKHNVDNLEELIKIQDNISTQLSGFGDITQDIESLQNSITKLETSLVKKAEVISKRRKKTAPEFEKAVHEMLIPLSMENAYIKVDIAPLEKPGPSGMDQITFLFAPNKGSDFKSLKDIASGGEISRLTLCIKSLVANAMTLPTLIFDEIDTGVSGEVASRMGEILSGLADQHQVISITHSPQIAAKADRHFFVHKNDREDRTVTAIKELDKEGRIIEIAKMLSGNPPSAAAIENAKELMK